jgi:hypothetical protein
MMAILLMAADCSRLVLSRVSLMHLLFVAALQVASRYCLNALGCSKLGGNPRETVHDSSDSTFHANRTRRRWRGDGRGCGRNRRLRFLLLWVLV